MPQMLLEMIIKYCYRGSFEENVRPFQGYVAIDASNVAIDESNVSTYASNVATDEH